MLINEYLYSVYDPEQKDKILTDVSAESNWSSAISANLQVSKDSLYIAAAKCISLDNLDDLKY